MLRRLPICAAFACTCFLNSWVELAQDDSYYFARYSPLQTVIVPVLCWEALLTAIVFAAWTVARNNGWTRYGAAHVVLLTACVFPLGIAAIAATRLAPFNPLPLLRNRLFLPAALLACGALLVWAITHIRAASRLARNVLLGATPILLLATVQGLRTGLRFPVAAYADGNPAPVLPTPPNRARVVWIVFDELSQEIAFSRRPPSLRLPEFDRLRAHSFYAEAAHSPSNTTRDSMPALIGGRAVESAEPATPANLLLRTAGDPQGHPWPAMPSIFDTARSLGFNTGVSGWYHPYGRVLQRSLTRCYWTPIWLNSGMEELFAPQSLLANMRDRAAMQLDALPLVGHLPGMFPGARHRREKIRRYTWLLAHAKELAVDPSLGLVLLHLPVPHPPPISSRTTGQFTSRIGNSYLDSVALADAALGSLRRAMEEAGVWDRTAVLVSADHGWRTATWRGGPGWTAEDETAANQPTGGVPFVLKLPGQKASVSYPAPFNTVATARLIAAVLRGELTRPEDVPALILGAAAAPAAAPAQRLP
jgi:hypothetical protein